MKFGTVELGKRPAVILVPDWSRLKEELERARELKIDLIEARVDLMEPSRVKGNLNLIADYGFYSVLTVRPDWEGGGFKGSEEERLRLFESFVSHPAVGAVDVELRAEILPQVRDMVREEGKKLVVSYHDFEKTPDREEIEELFRRAVDKGADVVKLALWVGASLMRQGSARLWLPSHTPKSLWSWLKRASLRGLLASPSAPF